MPVWTELAPGAPDHAWVREHFRPNLWPNTPDILTEYLQIGGRPVRRRGRRTERDFGSYL